MAEPSTGLADQACTSSRPGVMTDAITAILARQGAPP